MQKIHRLNTQPQQICSCLRCLKSPSLRRRKYFPDAFKFQPLRNRNSLTLAQFSQTIIVIIRLPMTDKYDPHRCTFLTKPQVFPLLPGSCVSYPYWYYTIFCDSVPPHIPGSKLLERNAKEIFYIKELAKKQAS